MQTNFFSTFVNKVDTKGRVSVPAPFRSLLDSTGYNGILVLPSFRLPALEGSGVDRIATLRKKLESFDEFSSEYEQAQALFSEAAQLPMDPEGRVSIPAALMEHANITGQVAFVGAGPVFQIWEPGAYNTHKMLMRERNFKSGLTLPAERSRTGTPA